MIPLKNLLRAFSNLHTKPHRVGEILDISTSVFLPGTLTNSSRDVYIQIPLSKPLSNVHGAVFLGKVNIRQQGYLVQDTDSTTIEMSSTVYNSEGIQLLFSFPNGLKGVNNDTVSVQLTGKIKLV